GGWGARRGLGEGASGLAEADLQVVLRVGPDVLDQLLERLHRIVELGVELVVLDQLAERALTPLDAAGCGVDHRAQRVETPRELVHLVRRRGEVIEGLAELALAIGGEAL